MVLLLPARLKKHIFKHDGVYGSRSELFILTIQRYTFGTKVISLSLSLSLYYVYIYIYIYIYGHVYVFCKKTMLYRGKVLE